MRIISAVYLCLLAGTVTLRVFTGPVGAQGEKWAIGWGKAVTERGTAAPSRRHGEGRGRARQQWLCWRRSTHGRARRF